MSQNEPPKTPRPVIIVSPSEQRSTAAIAAMKMKASVAGSRQAKMSQEEFRRRYGGPE